MPDWHRTLGERIMNLPSIKTLQSVFGHHARTARVILEMNRDALESIPVCEERIRECYHAPRTEDLRLTALNAIAGTYGIEGFECRDGSWCDYLNVGDPYVPTLVLFRGRYRVACWGDIAEKHAS